MFSLVFLVYQQQKLFPAQVCFSFVSISAKFPVISPPENISFHVLVATGDVNDFTPEGHRPGSRRPAETIVKQRYHFPECTKDFLQCKLSSTLRSHDARWAIYDNWAKTMRCGWNLASRPWVKTIFSSTGKKRPSLQSFLYNRHSLDYQHTSVPLPGGTFLCGAVTGDE